MVLTRTSLGGVLSQVWGTCGTWFGQGGKRRRGVTIPRTAARVRARELRAQSGWFYGEKRPRFSPASLPAPRHPPTPLWNRAVLFGACGVSLCSLAVNLLSERRLANILLFHRSAFHFVDFSRTVNRFGLTFPTLRIIGLLFKNTYIPKPFLKILIQEIKIRNHESVLVLFLLCGAACGVLVPLPGREPRPLTVDAQSLNRRTAGKVPESVLLLGTSGDSRI